MWVMQGSILRLKSVCQNCVLGRCVCLCLIIVLHLPSLFVFFFFFFGIWPELVKNSCIDPKLRNLEGFVTQL